MSSEWGEWEASSSDEWGTGEVGSSPVLVPRRAPLAWLVPAVLAALGGALLATWFPPSWWSLILGWALAGPIGVAFLTLFVNRDIKARSASLYVKTKASTVVYWGAVVVVVVAVIWTAIQLADWWARQ